MTQLGEMVAVVAGSKDEWECPFPHRPRKHNKKNKMTNDAGTLSDNLDEESANDNTIQIKSVPDMLPVATGSSGTPNHKAKFVAHHLIPGNASWPNSELLKWVEKSKGHIKGDIGYDVNGATNGIDLPSHQAISGWAAKSPNFQRRYTFACMALDKKIRQYHDSHEAYSDFVVEALDKIAAKLDEKPSREMGCGEEDCAAGKKKPFTPPYYLLGRIFGIALRLKRYLYGSPRRWKKPIMTSRFALMYKSQNLGQAQARELLKKEKFLY